MEGLFIHYLSDNTLQEAIISALKVTAVIDPQEEIRKLVDFMKDIFQKNTHF